MTSSLPTLRRRAIAAEDRADVLSRSLKRTKATLATSRAACAQLLDERDDARICATTLRSTLYRIAAHQLGIAPSRLRERAVGEEVNVLVDRWLREGARRSRREGEEYEAKLTAQLGRVMGRLFGGGEDGDG